MAEDTAKNPVVLVTGAAGLIGAPLLRDLAPHYDTVAFDVVEPDEKETPTDWIKCDLTEDESVASALAQLRDGHGGAVAGVIHLAAYYDFSGEPSPLYRELTVEGTRRLLRGLQDFEVAQFIFSSSLLVMKPAEPDNVLTEFSPVQAEWEYPQSKLDTEALIEKEHGDVPALVLRIAGVYDEGCHSIPLAQQIKRIYEKEMESYFFPGNTELGQSFVHLDDVVDCLVRAVEHRGELGPYEVLLIGEPDVVSYGELQERIGESLHGTAWPTIRVPKAVAKAGAWVKEKLPDGEKTFIKPWMVDLADAHYPVDPRRAKEKLGWEPRHSLRETLDTMLDRLDQNTQQWYEENKLPVPAELKT
jgi:nucleoside-diphosphate-sugar epimerase